MLSGSDTVPKAASEIFGNQSILHRKIHSLPGVDLHVYLRRGGYGEAGGFRRNGILNHPDDQDVIFAAVSGDGLGRNSGVLVEQGYGRMWDATGRWVAYRAQDLSRFKLPNRDDAKKLGEQAKKYLQ